MTIALSPEEQISYIPVADRELPKEQQTTYYLELLDPDDAAALQDTSAVVDSHTRNIHVNMGRNVLTALRLGLKGWDNLRNKAGDDVGFETNGSKLQIPGIPARPRDYVSNKSLKCLHNDLRTELAGAIQDGTSLDEEDVKN